MKKSRIVCSAIVAAMAMSLTGGAMALDHTAHQQMPDILSATMMAAPRMNQTVTLTVSTQARMIGTFSPLLDQTVKITPTRKSGSVSKLTYYISPPNSSSQTLLGTAPYNAPFEVKNIAGLSKYSLWVKGDATGSVQFNLVDQFPSVS